MDPNFSEDDLSKAAKAFSLANSPSAQPQTADALGEAANAFLKSRSAKTQQATQSQLQSQPKTMFQKARAAAPEEKELSWGEVGSQAVKNFLPSTGGALAATGKALMHPIDTLSTIGELGTGLASQAAGAVGIEQDPAKKAKNEALINALEDHYKQAYGSTKGFKKALAEDPASVLMDLSTVVTGGGSAASKLLGATTKAGKVAAAAASAGSKIDPVQLALKTAAIPVNKVAKAIPYAQSFMSGASVDSLKTAAKAGAENDPEARAAFTSHLSGEAPPSQLVDEVEKAISAKAERRSNEYIRAQKQHFSGELPTLDWNPVINDFRKNYDSLRTDFGAVINDNAAKALGEVGDAIKEWKSNGNSTIKDFDSLKKKIGDIRRSYGSDPQAVRVTTDMYNSVIDAIKAKHPEYAEMMEKYAEASDELFQLKSSFGIGKKLSDESILRKLLSAGKSKNKQNLLAELAEENPNIPYMLAGQEMSNWLPGGQRQIGHILTASLYGANPLGLAAQAAAGSPRLAANINYKAGQAARLAGKATATRIAQPAYVVGRSEQDQTSADSGSVFDRMLGVESGNKQFTESGAPVTSSKGATGVAQVMPSTGPEAAALAGEKWDPERLKSDQAYNAKLGKSYFDNLVQRFGNSEMAAAAYNAGDRRVEEAIQKAKLQGGNYIDYLPEETKNYLRKVFGGNAASGGRIERASGGAVGGHEKLVNRMMMLAEKAKRETKKATESLLAQPDEAVVKALSVAQEAI